MLIRLVRTVLAVAVMSAPALAGGHNAELDVRNTVKDFEHAWKKGDLEAIAKLVTPDFVALQNGEVKASKREAKNFVIPLPAFQVGTNIERVEVSCNLAWVYGQVDASNFAAGADKRRFVLTRLYVLKQKGHRWRVAALSWNVSPQSLSSADK